MDIKVKKRDNHSITLTFEDISTRTTIPISISDALVLQERLSRTVRFCAVIAETNEPNQKVPYIPFPKEEVEL